MARARATRLVSKILRLTLTLCRIAELVANGAITDPEPRRAFKPILGVCDLLKTFHIAPAVWQKTEIKAKVKILGVVSDQGHSFEIFEIRVFESRVNQPRPQSFSSSFCQDIDIAQIRMSDKVGDYPGKPNLSVAFL